LDEHFYNGDISSLKCELRNVCFSLMLKRIIDKIIELSLSVNKGFNFDIFESGRLED
jgi:hypothetical protein